MARKRVKRIEIEDKQRGQKLTAVAKTGAAADVTIADASNKITATNVEGALTELATSIETVNTNNAVTMTSDDGSGDVLKVYTIKQGTNTVGTINIPKDLVAVSGQIVYKDGENNDGTFIKLTIQNGNPFYIDVASLIEYNSVDSTAEVTLSQDANHKITATIGKIAASKIDYTTGENGETVAQAISRIDTALGAGGSVASQIQTEIEKLDADLDASGTAQHSGTFVVSGVTEVDGVITSVDSVEVEAAGAAATAKATIDNYTVNGKKISTNPVLDGSNINVDDTAATKETVKAAIEKLGTADSNSVKSVNTKTPTNGAVTINGSDIALTGYQVGTYSAIAATDTVNQAIAKLEGGYITYTEQSGDYADTTI